MSLALSKVSKTVKEFIYTFCHPKMGSEETKTIDKYTAWSVLFSNGKSH